MNKLAIALVFVFCALIAGVALSLDNSPRPTQEQDNAAYLEWIEMPIEARSIICNLFKEGGNNYIHTIMTENGLDPGEIRARIDIMNREC